MAKNKGKKKGDAPKQPAVVNEAPDATVPPAFPPAAQQASPEPKPIRLAPRINTSGIQSPKGASPSFAQPEISSGTQVADDWAGQGQLSGWDEGPTQTHQDDNWDPDQDYADDGSGTGSRTHTSPSTGTYASPTFAHPGQTHDANPGAWGVNPQGMSPQVMNSQGGNPSRTYPQGTDTQGHGVNLNAVDTMLVGFGTRPDPTAGTEPTLKRRNTLKKHPPAAPPAPDPPAPTAPAKQHKHVAFGGLQSLLHLSAGHNREATAPPPAPNTTTPSGLHSNRAIPPNKQPHGGWPGPEILPTSSGGFAGQHASQSPWRGNTTHLSHNAPSAATPRVAMAHIPSSSTGPYARQAWAQWPNEAKKLGMPAVATAVTASIPAANNPYSPYSPYAPAPPPPQPSTAAGGNAAMIAMMQQRQAQLQAILEQKAAAAMTASLQTQLPQSARQPTGPVTPQATWQYFRENGHLPTPVQGRQPELHAQMPHLVQMQQANNWGSDWNAASGGGGGGGGRGGEWGQGTADDGGWGKGGAGAGAGAGGGGGWDAAGTAANDGWGNVGGDPWGTANDTSGWGASGADHGDKGGKKSHRSRNTAGRRDSRHKGSPHGGDAGRWGTGGGNTHGGGGDWAQGDGGWGQSNGDGWNQPSGGVGGQPDNSGWGGQSAISEWGQGGGGGGTGHGKGKSDAGGWGQSNGDGYFGDSRGKSRAKEGGSRHNRGPSSNGHDWSDWEKIDEVPEEEEEDEDYDEDDEDEDDLEDMYAEPRYDGRNEAQTPNRRNTHISPRISYLLQSPGGRGHPLQATGTPQSAPTLQGAMHRRPQDTAGVLDPNVSQTMNFAMGRMDKVFPPSEQRRPGEVIIFSHGAALDPAERALFHTQAVDPEARPAKHRIHWMFNPDKDPHVSSLIRWVQNPEMSNHLAIAGLRKLLETGQRGALIANAEFRVNSVSGMPAQPAFDWITLQDASSTLDPVLQRSILRYNPAQQVLVFVFLLSKSGNSMAMWRRKCPIPEATREGYQGVIDRTVQRLQTKAVILVDELPLPKPPPEEPEKKKRSWWKKIFLFWKR